MHACATAIQLAAPYHHMAYVWGSQSVSEAPRILIVPDHVLTRICPKTRILLNGPGQREGEGDGEGHVLRDGGDLSLHGRVVTAFSLARRCSPALLAQHSHHLRTCVKMTAWHHHVRASVTTGVFLASSMGTLASTAEPCISSSCVSNTAWPSLRTCQQLFFQKRCQSRCQPALAGPHAARWLGPL